ncbi:hypothetical protein ACFX13_001222 [Malus domestica]|uniref:Uncharacterized protein n=1 Tax=Malus domestica TaxID=3750 RepID=A0A498KVW0_MALDO|nr:hypothetical protein DVH24_023217 [Malus domestica]
MESKSNKPVKSGKGSKATTNTIPPKRGQIKARIFEEIVETVTNIAAAGAVGGKCGAGSSSTVYSYTSE